MRITSPRPTFAFGLSIALLQTLGACDAADEGALAGTSEGAPTVSAPPPVAGSAALPPGTPPAPCEDAWLAVIPGDVWPSAVASVDGADVVVAGTFAGPGLALGGRHVARSAPPEIGTREGFVARLDGETCAASWLVTLGPDVGPADVATNGAQVVVVSGRELRALGAADGAAAWSRTITGGASAWLSAVAVAPDGRVFVAGTGMGTLALGDFTLWASDWRALGVVIALDAAGVARWGTVAACEARVRDLAATPEGDLVLAGSAWGELMLGLVETTCDTGDESLWVARVSGGDGRLQWQRPLGVLAAEGPRVAVDATGNTYAAALYYALDEDPIAARGRSVGDARDRQLVTRLCPAGAMTWAVSTDATLVRHMGGAPPSVALAGDQLIVAGVVLEPTAFDEAQHVTPAAPWPDFEGFVSRWAPHMPVMWGVEPIGGAGDQMVVGIAGDDAGRSWVVGWFGGDLEVPGELATRDGRGAFIARRPAGPGY